MPAGCSGSLLSCPAFSYLTEGVAQREAEARASAGPRGCSRTFSVADVKVCRVFYERTKMLWLKGTRPPPCKALVCVASRFLRNLSPAAPGRGELLFFKLPELSTACPLPASLVRSPAWFSEARLVPYVHATEAFSCLSGGT